MLKELLKRERTYLDYFFSHLDINQMEKIFEVLKGCKGLLIFSGVGKSGLVAEKIALTMTSTGTRALFLSPNNALHGDIGIVSPEDVFILLSKSGESEELLQLLPFLRNRKVTLIGVTSNPASRLHKACDISVALPLQQELCPFGMAPTTSTTIQCIFGDILTVALMTEKKFSLDDYAQNHPSGRIGKRVSLKVNDIMVREEGIPTCRPDEKLMEILVRLSDKRCGCILIQDEMGILMGIFTDGDLRRSLQEQGPDVLYQEMRTLMNTTAKTIEPDVLAYDALKKMEQDQKHPITVLPVVDANKMICGIVKMHDLIQSGV